MTATRQKRGQWMVLALSLQACSPGLDDYFDVSAETPVLVGLQTDPQVDQLGRHIAVIEGENLDSANVVVFGTRNAEIVGAGADFVRVIIPDQPSFATLVDVAVATDYGVARMADAFPYTTAVGDWDDSEVASAAVYAIDCPVEGWGQQGHVRYPLYWCAAEAGYADAVAWVGIGSQEGNAADLAELGPLSAAPLPGEVRFYGPGERRPPVMPVLPDYHAEGDGILLRTHRDLDRDLAFIDDREANVESNYYWVDGIDSWYGDLVQLYDEQCFINRYEVIGSTLDTLRVVPEPPVDATGLWLGFGFQETYDDDPEVYVTEAWTATARIIDIDGGTIVLDDNDVSLFYDDFSGYYFHDGVAGILGQSDIPFGATWDVSTARLGSETQLGQVRGGDPLDVIHPDLMTGSARARVDRSLTVQWSPGIADEDPAIIVFELFIYDSDIDDPNYKTELYRVVATEWDSKGHLTIPAAIMARLPVTPNRLDSNDEETGRWGDVNVSRHQLRKLPTEGGDLVVDFMAVVNAPLQLKTPPQ